MPSAAAALAKLGECWASMRFGLNWGWPKDRLSTLCNGIEFLVECVPFEETLPPNMLPWLLLKL